MPTKSKTAKPEFDPEARTRVFLMDDPEMTKAYIKFCKAHHRLLAKCRKEVIAETGHDAALYDARTHVYLAGITERPHGWDWAKAKEERVAKLRAEVVERGEDPKKFTAYWVTPEATPIPAGWRKRVKDDFLCPPLKGGGPEAEAARALCKKWNRIEGPRGYLKRVHGVKWQAFVGMSFITIGIDVLDEKTDPKVYVIAGGPEFKVEDMTGFREVKHSSYLAAKGE